MAQRQIPEGSSVAFLTPKHSWVLGKVISFDARQKTYTCAATEPEPIRHDKVKHPDEVWAPRLEYLDEDVNDLLQLTELHEASLLFCLKKRYLRDVVYTNIGPIVVALNPFNYEIPWYKDDVMPQYLSEGIEIERNLPHSWAVAHNTYWEMKENHFNQTILISGESGAGKTEAAKIVVKYLGALSTLHGTKEQQEACALVNTKLLAASPILEAFGNAKTVRNDNSSRFGKFMKIQFDRDGFLIGSFATKYLLEKSRIVGAAPNERIYHSFYQVASGEDQKQFGLRSLKIYRVLNSGDCVEIPGVDDGHDYSLTKRAMFDVGISADEQNAIWRVVAGILYFLNLEFDEQEQRSGKVASIPENVQGVIPRVCELWDISEEDFEREILQTTITARGESTARPHTKAQATDTRDTVAKSLYDWLFDWLVDKINSTSDTGDRTDQWIGLLDIFGFEDFKKNYFEQVCINLANETLQNHYNNHIFTEDMKECKEEGIDTSDVSFVDNKECIELLTGKIGVLTLLDEECKVNGSEANYLQKLISNFQGSKTKAGHKYFLPVTGKEKDSGFRIRHYAGDVTYLLDNMLEKNRDTLKDAMKLLLSKSKVPLIASLVPPLGDDGRPSAKKTVGGFFVQQLQELMTVIHSTNPHWIRCIKPHPDRKPRMFDHLQVMTQLRSAGVLDTVRVRKAGYPIRFKKDLFIQRYKILTLEGEQPGLKSRDATEVCSAIFKKLDIDSAIGQLGKTKVFLRQAAFTKLNHAKDEATEVYGLMFQSIGRASVVRATLFEHYVQMHRARILAEKKAKEEALRRQREEEERRRKAEEEERQRRERAEEIQRYRAAVTIQRHTRGILVRQMVFMYFMELQRSQDEAALDGTAQMYRNKWDDVDRHVKLVEKREHEKRERTRQDDLEEYVRFQHPEYLAERREISMKRLDERLEKKKRQAEREEMAAKNRVREEMAMRRRQKEAAAQAAADKRKQQASLRAAHREKTAQAEQAAAIAAAKQNQAIQHNREEMERKLVEQIKEMEAERDDQGRSEFDRLKEEWKRNERWAYEREKRFAEDQKRVASIRRQDITRQSLIDGQQYQYVPNLMFSPPPRHVDAMFSPGRRSGEPSVMLSPEESQAEKEYRRRKLEEASRTAQTIAILRKHSRN